MSALPHQWAQHPVLVTEQIRHPFDVQQHWSNDQAVVLEITRPVTASGADGYLSETAGTGTGLFGVGDPHAAAQLLAGADLSAVTRFSLPRGTIAAAQTSRPLPTLFSAPCVTWDWMCLSACPSTAPYLTQDAHVEELTDLQETLAAHATVASTGELLPTEERSRWWGWRDDSGVIRSLVGASLGPHGAPWVLGSIGTDENWWGRGLAAVTTAAAVKEALSDATLVTLALYASNTAALNLYYKLGFTLEACFESSRFAYTNPEASTAPTPK